MQKLQDVKIGVSRVLILCLIVAVLTAGIVYSQSSPMPFTITKGVYPGAPSYTVWAEDGTVFAKNQYGVIAYSGDDEATIFQYITDSGDAVILLKAGTYTIDSNVTTSNRLTINGEGAMNTEVDIADGVYWITSSAHYLNLKGLYIKNLGAGGVVVSHDILHSSFQELVVEGNPESSNYAFQLNQDGPVYEVIFDKCSINNYEFAIQFSGGEIMISNSKFGAHLGYKTTLDIVSSQFIQISNCGFEAATLTIEGCNDFTLNNLQFWRVRDRGIWLYNSENGTISNVNIQRLSLLDDAYGWGIDLGGSRNTVISNVYMNIPVATNIRGIGNDGDYNMLSMINTHDVVGSDAPIHIAGANSKVSFSWNGTSWIS